VGQILSENEYFTRRMSEEIARSKRGRGRFSVVVLTSQPPEGELPEIACVRGLPAILTGVRETDCVTRTGRDTIAVMLIDSDGDESQTAAIRLLERMGDDAARWSVRVLQYPTHESALAELGLVA
jgi:hypothetical protein